MAKKIVLKCPVTVGDLTVNEITIQRPKVKDFMALGKMPVESAEADAALLSSLSGLPLAVISQIDIEDWSLLRIEIAFVWDTYFTGKEYSDKDQPENQET